MVSIKDQNLEDQGWIEFLTWDHLREVPYELITYPDQYTGGTDLRLSITQLNISPSKQKSLINEWCELLPKLNNVTTIWFYSRVNQKIFDAVYEMNNLEGLFIKWSGNGINDISPIRKLKRLYIGSTTQIDDLSPLSELADLEWLQFEMPKISSLVPLIHLKKLKGLMIFGPDNKKQEIDSFEPIAGLENLLYLSTSRVVASDGSLEAISRLRNLKYLDIPIYYDMSEFAKLYVALKNTDHGIYAYRDLTDWQGYKCTKCGEYKMVMPMGKGRRTLCRVCNPKKVTDLESEFNEFVEKYS